MVDIQIFSLYRNMAYAVGTSISSAYIAYITFIFEVNSEISFVITVNAGSYPRLKIASPDESCIFLKI